MELNLAQLQAVALGAVSVTREEGGYYFHRFTDAQEEFYRLRDAGHYTKTFAPAGIKLHFKTDSTRLFLQAEMTNGSSRFFFAFDVYVNGELIGSMDNFTGVELPVGQPTVELPLGLYEKEFELGPGEKELAVYLPFSVKTLVKCVALDDGAFIEPLKSSKKLLAFGDSITHGYDALHPANMYITRVAEVLDAEEFNKGIGGEIFVPGLAALREPYDPDYITVAYGTNDWARCTDGRLTVEEYRANCRAFYKTISDLYPAAKIYAISPIWRKGGDTAYACGTLAIAEEIISDAVAELSNVTLIPGADLVPHEEELFADLRLHPNDAGFAHYAKNLLAAIG
ncbi:MAG: SGNH/GDSL hydrolase family protein [Clostridia bacterium]|nr:SGNH/GDSL hydrolase family protein [Clostridia bacterium]